MDLGNLAAQGATVLFSTLLVGFVLTIGMMALGLWMAYTIIWKAVRRGLREFEAEVELPTRARRTRPLASASPPIRPLPGPRDW